MVTGVYVVVALFQFGTYPVFTELVGVAMSSPAAFDLLDKYNYKKVIASEYEMTIEEKRDRLKRDFGIRSDTNKTYYEERRRFEYQIKDDEEKHLVDVIFTIYEA